MIDILNQDVSKLNYIPENKIKTLHRLKIYTIRDLIFYCPRYYKIKEYNPVINSETELRSKNVILYGVIEKVKNFYKGPAKIIFCYQGMQIELIFFSKISPFLLQCLKIGSRCFIEGELKFDKTFQIAHPNFLFKKEDIKLIEPIYSLTYGITNYSIHNFIKKSVNIISDNALLEKVEYNLVAKYNKWPSILESLKILHCLTYVKEIDKWSNIAVKRLASDELISYQVNLQKFQKTRQKLHKFSVAKELKKSLLQKLPFALTKEQTKVLEKIESSQESNLQMVKLLQGDVGSGKTIIAVISMLNVVQYDKQATIMAPTELLAKQHYQYVRNLTQDLGIESELLTGQLKSKEKKRILKNIEDGTTKIIVGTHSIFQEKVKFKNLAYVVIDEQHRFGVMQRFALVNKAKNPIDVLLLSATPIPRSLMLILFGNIDILTLENTIKNRKKIITSAIGSQKEDDIYKFIEKVIARDEKIYWVCPHVEESEKNPNANISNVEDRFEKINTYFPDAAVVIHGKMNSDEKIQKMDMFLKEKSILVATTIVEVGINVSNATLIIIENAEKFGLSQLHQLRGRVGRSDLQSYCILMYDEKNLTPSNAKRLKIIKSLTNGFLISKEDLQIRGGGDVMGVKQSGKADFFFIDRIDQEEEVLNEITSLATKIMRDKKACDVYCSIFPFDQEISGV